MRYLKSFLTGLVIFVAGLEVGVVGLAFLFKVGVQMVADESKEEPKRRVSYRSYYDRTRES